MHTYISVKFPIYNANRKIYAVCGIATDITERKRTEAQLQASEERFRKIFEEGPVGMVIADLNFSLIQANAAFCNMLGYTKEELVGMTVFNLTYPEDREKNKNLLNQAINGEISYYQLDKRYIKKNGQLLWGSVAVSFFYNENGKPLYCIAKIEDITERKRIEKALKKSQQQYETVVHSVDGVVWEADAKTFQFTFVSPQAERFLGYPAEDWLQPTFWVDHLHPDDKGWAPEFCINSTLGKQDHEFEYRMITANNQTIWVRDIVSVIVENGQPVRLCGVMLDVTLWKQAEKALIENDKALQETNRFLENIMNTTTNAIFVLNLEGQFMGINRASTKISGYSVDELMGQPFSIVLAQNIFPHIYEVFLKTVVHGKTIYQYETEIIRKDGNVATVSFSLAPMLEGEKIVSLVGTAEDITERKQVEEKLFIHSKILENLAEAINLSDENGKSFFTNPAFDRMFGYEPGELKKKQLSIINTEAPQKNRRIMREIRDALKNNGFWKGEFNNRKKDGTHFVTSARISRLEISGMEYWVSVQEDITERKQVEQTLKEAKEQAESANRAKSEFLANMSHEIRTPMNAVLGFSELLSKLVVDSQQKNYLDAIQTSGKTLLSLINDILDLSKIEAGRLKIQYEAINPHTLFNELQQIFAFKIADKKLDFIVEIDNNLPEALRLDETRLRQVLLNIIGNAIKFTEKGYIKLSAQKISKINHHSKLDLIISITDTGIGIPKDQKEIIFESFRQQDGQSTRKYGGTGLGLAISKRLVEMMDGHISVSSQVGTGSCFEITLENVEVAAIVDQVDKQSTCDFKQISFEKAQVLVVDDVESNRYIVKECLSEAALEVIEAENGQQALLFAKKYHPDLILMDLRMPVMDGYEATKQLKKNQFTQNIPIIALTASYAPQSKMMELPFDGYLSKPVNIPDLFETLLPFLKQIENPSTENVILTPEQIAKLPDLIKTLKNNMMPIWKEINGVLEMDSIEDFATSVVKLGMDYNVPFLINYAENLREFAQNFDVTNINKTLKIFPEVVEEVIKLMDLSLNNFEL